MPAHDALRDSIEAEIIRRLQALAPRHRAVLDGILLAEGDPRKIKGRTWHALARDFKRELYGALIWAAHGAAVGNWLDLGAPDLNDPGEGLQPEDRPSLIGIDLPPLSRSVEVALRRWCDARAGAVADGMVQTAIKQLESLRSDLRGRLTEHMGPGPHPNGSPQSVHGRGAKASASAPKRKQTDSAAFKKWFGDSKVVDGQGQPLVVYKGMYPYDWTNETDDAPGPEITAIDRKTPFPAFNGDEPGVKIAGFFGDAATANRFAAGGGTRGAVYPVYLSLQHPKVIDAAGRKAGEVQFFESGREFRDAIRSGNYDGVIIKNTEDEGTIYVALKPSQIKSAIGNRGTFDPDSDKLTEARRSPAKRRKAKAKAKRRRKARRQASRPAPSAGRLAKPDASGASELFDRQPQYAELLDKLYGNDRWKLIAQTETTGSIVAGEVAILRTLEKNRGWKFDMLWKTQVDERRCPICKPLHNKHRDYFARRVGFPPAHPRCRCYLSYRVLSKPKGSPGVSRKAATKMPATGLKRRRRKPQKKSA